MDPAQWLTTYDRGLARMAANAQAAEAGLRQAGGTAVSPRGEIEVKVGPSGALVDLRLTPAARALEADRLAQLILATAQEAQRAVGNQVVGIMTEYVGEGPALDMVRRNLPSAAGQLTDVRADDDYFANPEITQ